MSLVRTMLLVGVLILAAAAQPLIKGAYLASHSSSQSSTPVVVSDPDTVFKLATYVYLGAAKHSYEFGNKTDAEKGAIRDKALSAAAGISLDELERANPAVNEWVMQMYDLQREGAFGEKIETGTVP